MHHHVRLLGDLLGLLERPVLTAQDTQKSEEEKKTKRVCEKNQEGTQSFALRGWEAKGG